MTIAQNLKKIKSSLPEGVKLVAVSKFKSNEDILEAYQARQTVFGENRVQELTEKYEQLPKDIEWHMVGHLQTNKVKYIVPFVHLIHGVDGFKLLKEIDKQALKVGRVQNCLLQIHIAQEETKFGFDREEVLQMLTSAEFAALQNIQLCGVMGMATLTDDKEQVHKEFRGLKQLFSELKQSHFALNDSFKEISMGMSGDYVIAVEEGSTLVRIGSSIFGVR